MSSKFLDKTGLDTLWAKIKSTFQTLGNLVTAWGSTPSDTKYPSEKLVKTSLDAKAPNAVTTEAAIATDDKLLFSDASDSGKTKRMSTGFDTGVTTTMLRRDGTFARVLYADESWGGAFRVSLSPIDVFGMMGHNVFLGAFASCIKVEYSTDGGTTWLDYGLTDMQKMTLFSQFSNSAIIAYCGKNTHIQPGYTGTIAGTKDLTNDIIANQRLRITISSRPFANEGTKSRAGEFAIISRIRRLGLLMSTQSAGAGTHCVVSTRTTANFEAGNDVWATHGDFKIQGDSGWNSIPCDNGTVENGFIFGGYGTGGAAQYNEIRFEIWSTQLIANPASSQTGNLAIYAICGLADKIHSSNSKFRAFAMYGYNCTSVDLANGYPVFGNGIKFAARKLKTNLARTADSTFDGSADQENIPVTGTLGIANGGTGKTTVASGNYLVGNGTNALSEKTPNVAANDLINALTTGEATPTGDDYYVAQYAGGGTTTKTYHRRPIKALWEYIKTQISSVLGLTVTSYGGNAATATSADGYTSGGAIDTALQGKQDDIGIEPSTGDASKFLNEKGAWVVPSGVDSVVFTISGTSITNEMYADIIQAVSEDKIVTFLRGATGNTLMYRLTGVDSAGGIFASRSAGNSIYSISISPIADAHEVTFSSGVLALSDHSHGNITSDGKSTSDPTSTTMFLRADGAWSVPPASYPPTGAAGKPVFFDSTGYPKECTMVGSQRDSILGQLHPDNLSSETNAIFFCVLSQSWVKGGYLTVAGALQKLTGLTTSATGSSLSPIFWNGSVFSTGCTFHSENIANVGTSGNADSGTGTIYVDTILNTSANTYTYSINADRFIQNKPYKICWLKGTSSAQIKLYRPSSGSNINLYSGTTAVATGKLLPLLGGTHGGSFTSTLIRTAANTFYLIWGY